VGPSCVREVKGARALVEVAVAAGLRAIPRYEAAPSRAVAARPALMGPGLARCRVAGPLGDGALARMTGLIKATPRVLPLAIGMLLVGGGIAGSARVSPVTLPSQADCFGDRAVASMSLRVVASRARAGVGICQEEPRKERQQGNDETRGPTRGRSLCIHVAVEALVGPSCIWEIQAA